MSKASQTPAAQYQQRVRAVLAELNIPHSLIKARRLPLHREAQRLAPVGLGTDGRDKLLTPAAAQAWLAMSEYARSDGVSLLLVSAFRSVDFQAALIRNKLQRGMSVEDVLQVNAPPGYSEHHTGRAVDIGTPGSEPLEEAFELSDAYVWLHGNAAKFGFSLSYPRGNHEGYLYEPWHWCWKKIP